MSSAEWRSFSPDVSRIKSGVGRLFVPLSGSKWIVGFLTGSSVSCFPLTFNVLGDCSFSCVEADRNVVLRQVSSLAGEGVRSFVSLQVAMAWDPLDCNCAANFSVMEDGIAELIDAMVSLLKWAFR